MTVKQPLRTKLVVLLIAGLLISAIAATTQAIRSTEQRREGESPSPAARAEAVTPTPSDHDLGRVIDEAIDKSEFASARWGVSVISLGDGRVLCARNADQLFTPASNMKMYTTAVALDLLGANYQWRTSVYANSTPDASGTVQGDLVLYGRGAPDLVAKPKKEEKNSLSQLADDLYQRGLRHVTGNVIGDESYFRAEQFGDGWQWNDLQWYFGAEPSALSINGNEFNVEIKPSNSAAEPPTVRLDSAENYVRLINNTATVKRGEPLTVGINRSLTDNDLKVWGEVPEGARGFGARLSVHDPAAWAAMLFNAALKARGITVAGETRSRDFRVPQSERLDPSRATELAYSLSKPLSEVVRATNKESINLNAELILRTLGRERGEMVPADAHASHERGDDEAGVAIVRLWLNRAGIAADKLALHDGSGLSRLDLVEPEVSARLLIAISKTASAAAFRDSLPLSGTDGTLQGRLGKYKDRVAAKTGSLVYDNSLSGYVTTADGEILAFSVMCNDQTGRASSTRLIDQIVGLLADYSPTRIKNP